MALPQKKKNTKPSSLPTLPLNQFDDTVKELNKEELLKVQKEEFLDEVPQEIRQNSLPKHDLSINNEEENFIVEPDKENDYRNDNDDKFVDKKEMKIIPIGGKKARAKDFDKRKNTLTPLKLFRILLILVILALFGFGIKNTFFPSNNFSKDEITQIAKTAVGETGFPTQKGQAFAEEFLKYYLTLDSNDKANQDVLVRFYSGAVNDDNKSFNNTIQNNSTVQNKQKIVGEPYTFEISPSGEDTTLYKISAFVTDEKGTTNSGPSGGNSGHWVSFAINVYYDKEHDTISITPESPILIPTYEVKNRNKIPEAEIIGTGEQDEEIKPKLFPTIAGFLKAYAKASNLSHNDILQYISNKTDPSLTNGFGDTVQLDGDDESAINDIKIYKTEEKNVWKADVVVKWKDSKNNGTSYSARYIITITNSDDGYYVTKFAPYVYITKQQTDDSERK